MVILSEKIIIYSSKMGDDFGLKRTNFVSILENDPEQTELFYKWIRFLNEHSIVSFALTTKTKLNVDLLRYVC